MQYSMNLILPESLASIYHNSAPAKQLVGLFGVSLDLEKVALTADKLGAYLNEPGPFDQEIAESYSWHIVVRYARCFMSDAGRSASLNRRDVERLNDAGFLTLHDGLIDRRNKTFAHAGEHCSDRLVIHLMADGVEGPKFAATPHIEGPGPIADPEQPAVIAQLARALIPGVKVRVERAAEATNAEVAAQGSAVLRELREHLGRHATPEQQAISIFARLRI